MPANQPDDQPAKRPELPLTLLEMAFSYAALSGKTALSCEYIEQAVHHSNRLRKEIRTNLPVHCKIFMVFLKNFI